MDFLAVFRWIKGLFGGSVFGPDFAVFSWDFGWQRADLWWDFTGGFARFGDGVFAGNDEENKGVLPVRKKVDKDERYM